MRLPQGLDETPVSWHRKFGTVLILITIDRTAPDSLNICYYLNSCASLCTGNLMPSASQLKGGVFKR